MPESPPGFELLRRIGGGGMGDVYLARERPADRLVALKFLQRPDHPVAYQRFVNELQALAALKHPNIVGVLASDFYRATPFFTMEFAESGSLSDALKPKEGEREPNLPSPEEAVRIIRVVAGAVAAAHAERIVHRDLKPSNVLLFGPACEWGALKVADFGLAKQLNGEELEPLTYTTDTLGTPGYMPPEQVSRANGEVDFRADVYGLGATLYHLLTGRAPFVGPTPHDIIHQVLAAPLTRPRALRPEVPMGLEAIVLKCLAKDPAERYQTVAAFLAALDNYEKLGRDRDTPLMTRVRRARLWAKRNRRRLATAVLVALVVGGAFALGAAYWRGAQPPDPLPGIKKELDAGGRVELMRADGNPRWFRWAVGDGALIPSETKDGTVALQTQGLALLELLSDPRRDRYRVTAVLRHLHANPDGAGVGVYLGFDRVAAPTGAAVHPVVMSEFNETFTRAELANRVQAQHGVDLVTARVLIRRDESPGFAGATGNGHLRFVPCPEQPRPWRVLVFEVSPEGVELFWATEQPAGVGAREFVGRLTVADLASQRQATRRDLGLLIGDPTPVVPEWHPRRPIGIWAIDSTVSIKSVTIEPF